jgi:hypothetical protein
MLMFSNRQDPLSPLQAPFSICALTSQPFILAVVARAVGFSLVLKASILFPKALILEFKKERGEQPRSKNT